MAIKEAHKDTAPGYSLSHVIASHLQAVLVCTCVHYDCFSDDQRLTAKSRGTSIARRRKYGPPISAPS